MLRYLIKTNKQIINSGYKLSSFSKKLNFINSNIVPTTSDIKNYQLNGTINIISQSSINEDNHSLLSFIVDWNKNMESTMTDSLNFMYKSLISKGTFEIFAVTEPNKHNNCYMYYVTGKNISSSYNILFPKISISFNKFYCHIN